MKTPFYGTPERQAAFLAEAWSWLGTPFRENSAVKGPEGGVDCVRFAMAVHEACGAVAGAKIEVMPVEWIRGWHQHHPESRVLDFFQQPSIRRRLKRVETDEDQPMVGDIVALQVGQCVHHVGLWCGPEVLHVAIPVGVVRISAGDPLLVKHQAKYFRIYA